MTKTTILLTFTLLCGGLRRNSKCRCPMTLFSLPKTSRIPRSLSSNGTETLLTIVRPVGAQPCTILSTRNFAMLHVALSDAVNEAVIAAETTSFSPPNALRVTQSHFNSEQVIS